MALEFHEMRNKAKGNEVFETIYGGDNEYFQANSPWILVEKNAKAIRDKTHIRIVVGDKDPLLKRNRDFHALLEKMEILHQFDEIPGVGHNSGPLYDGLGVRAAAFYDKAFEGVTK
jgi:esterase/lipase superfamily enzyme